ncbi:MAG: flagellar export protein FliJ [bacterium]
MNARRKFHLQKVLDVRKLVEKSRQKELASITQKLAAEQKALAGLENKRDDFTRTMNEIRKAEASQFRGNQAYLETLNGSIVEQSRTISAVEKEVDEKRQRLMEASKEKKALEKLKEKQVARDIYQENKIEQAVIDEVAIQKSRTMT